MHSWRYTLCHCDDTLDEIAGIPIDIVDNLRDVGVTSDYSRLAAGTRMRGVDERNHVNRAIIPDALGLEKNRIRAMQRKTA